MLRHIARVRLLFYLYLCLWNSPYLLYIKVFPAHLLLPVSSLYQEHSHSCINTPSFTQVALPCMFTYSSACLWCPRLSQYATMWSSVLTCGDMTRVACAYWMFVSICYARCMDLDIALTIFTHAQALVLYMRLSIVFTLLGIRSL